MKKSITIFIIVACLWGCIDMYAFNPIKEIAFYTKDSIKISATYEYPEINKSTIPAIILIHQGGSSREEWLDLPLWNDLKAAGYALLAIDLRQHGKSAKDTGDIYDLFNNPNRAPLDLLAAIEFLKKDKHIDVERIGIIGASIGGNLACVAASSREYAIKSAVSLSAKTSAAQNLSGQKEPIVPKNVFYIASKEEQNGLRKEWSNELYGKTKGERKVEIASGDKHGSFILRKEKRLQEAIVYWFENTLK
ncbi:alpha/beta hydrolase [Leptobacterium sp. I13]|uniref:alpha/beta hydrolase family protein n=1 Tax=Leptobacterium meishanense TaxID=3128904 RepID=UPI0030EC8F0C